MSVEDRGLLLIMGGRDVLSRSSKPSFILLVFFSSQLPSQSPQIVAIPGLENGSLDNVKRL